MREQQVVADRGGDGDDGVAAMTVGEAAEVAQRLTSDRDETSLAIDRLMLPTTIYARDPHTGQDVELTSFYDQNRVPVTFSMPIGLPRSLLDDAGRHAPAPGAPCVPRWAASERTPVARDRCRASA